MEGSSGRSGSVGWFFSLIFPPPPPWFLLAQTLLLLFIIIQFYIWHFGLWLFFGLWEFSIIFNPFSPLTYQLVLHIVLYLLHGDPTERFFSAAKRAQAMALACTLWPDIVSQTVR